ncbi:hypothetical protein LINGRAHAP2_LOCUS33823 [Linum grandiflorum]
MEHSATKLALLVLLVVFAIGGTNNIEGVEGRINPYEVETCSNALECGPPGLCYCIRGACFCNGKLPADNYFPEEIKGEDDVLN